MKYQIDKLLKEGYPVSTEIEKGVWVKARPIEYQGIGKWKDRIKEAWLVLKGKADIITWYKQ